MLPPAQRWIGSPIEHEVTQDTVRIVAGPRTDWFIHPGTGEVKLSAPALVALVSGDFILRARVKVAFGATFDAGTLVIRHDEGTWSKLCLEYSPDGEPMVVSVVTREVSDDCNSFVVGGDAIWLRAARIGRACAFHASSDGRRWQFVRHFRLVDADEVDVGFLAQSPTGDGCEVTFSHISFEAATLGDLRSGL